MFLLRSEQYFLTPVEDTMLSGVTDLTILLSQVYERVLSGLVYIQNELTLCSPIPTDPGRKKGFLCLFVPQQNVLPFPVYFLLLQAFNRDQHRGSVIQSMAILLWYTAISRE